MAECETKIKKRDIIRIIELGPECGYIARALKNKECKVKKILRVYDDGYVKGLFIVLYNKYLSEFWHGRTVFLDRVKVKKLKS